MENNQIIFPKHKPLIIFILGGIFLLLNSFSLIAQENPPKPIIVNISLEQGLQFGTFFHGSTGGTVIVSPDGSRSSTGDVYLIGFSGFPATFWIESNPGTIISMQPVPEITLTGSNGGSMTMNLGDSDPILPFIATAEQTQLRIGGTLNVGNALANPPGSYSATFFITFIQE